MPKTKKEYVTNTGNDFRNFNDMVTAHRTVLKSLIDKCLVD